MSSPGIGVQHFELKFMYPTFDDLLFQMELWAETILAEGEAAQTTTLRWEDYTQTAMDPADDCTIW